MCSFSRKPFILESRRPDGVARDLFGELVEAAEPATAPTATAGMANAAASACTGSTAAVDWIKGAPVTPAPFLDDADVEDDEDVEDVLERSSWVVASGGLPRKLPPWVATITGGLGLRFEERRFSDRRVNPGMIGAPAGEAELDEDDEDVAS